MNIRNAVNPTLIRANEVVSTDTSCNRVRRDLIETRNRNLRKPSASAMVEPPEIARNVANAVRSLAGG